eukprot:TRINITY_DN49604_c0_g1_i2.p1 TRINITY_DN49604_c0_g1~~TRINITY_DN49604_c0_g1_i2.p1  ORF type:complete len:272 (-),score=8.89 TRINITY_DN49604_c0_g1_i2:77-892(-)
MVVCGLLRWIKQQLLVGADVRCSMTYSVVKKASRARFWVAPTMSSSDPSSAIIHDLIDKMIDMSDRCRASDSGHKHSNGISVITIWFYESPISVHPVQGHDPRSNEMEACVAPPGAVAPIFSPRRSRTPSRSSRTRSRTCSRSRSRSRPRSVVEEAPVVDAASSAHAHSPLLPAPDLDLSSSFAVHKDLVPSQLETMRESLKHIADFEAALASVASLSTQSMPSSSLPTVFRCSVCRDGYFDADHNPVPPNNVFTWSSSCTSCGDPHECEF